MRADAALALLAAGLLCLAAPSRAGPWYGSGSPTARPTHPELAWERLLAAAPWGERAMPRGGLLGGRFYVLAGRAGAFTLYGDTWRSADGIAWERMSAGAGWGRRAYPEVEILDGQIILTGGQTLVTFYNDVWRSADEGRTWQPATPRAPWDVRAGHHTAVVNGELWLFGGARNSWKRVFYPELWVSHDLGATWELRARLPEDMGRAGMQVVAVGDAVYFMGGDHDVPVFFANWPGRRNDVWKSVDGGRSWALLGNAPWVPRTGHQCAGWRDRILCLGGHVRGPEAARSQYLAHDLWMWDPRDGMAGWQLVSNTAWGCADDQASCGKSDFLMLIRDDQLWTFGGDREVAAPWPQDNDVWRLRLPEGGTARR